MRAGRALRIGHAERGAWPTGRSWLAGPYRAPPRHRHTHTDSQLGAYWTPIYPLKSLLAPSGAPCATRAVHAHSGRLWPLVPQAVPIILAGDFNSTWRRYRGDEFEPPPLPGSYATSGVYELLSGGALEPTHRHHPAQRPRRGCQPYAVRASMPACMIV